VTTIKEALAEGARKLYDADPQNNRRTARVLLARVVGCEQERLLARPEDLITALQYAEYLDAISRRARGEPLQHITGHQEFYGLDFLVSPDVLIPRPETEFLVEQILRLAASPGAQPVREGVTEGQYADHGQPGTPRHQPGQLILDVGTGSGCIAIALAIHLPMARIIATDISQTALAVARKNADTHGVAARIQFLLGDLFCPVQHYHLDESIDFIACNPPYVPSGRPDLVQRDVRDFEPAMALYGGPDGLSFYRRLLVEAPGYLRPRGFLVCEIGYSQLESIRAMVDLNLWEFVEAARDLQGIPRTLTLAKR
jgi:release factor glutamine methyltransferase